MQSAPACFGEHLKDSFAHPPRLWLPSIGGALSLRVNFAWTLIGNGIYAISQWAILVVLAKLGSAEMVGQFALGTAIALPIILCANLYLRAMVATDAREEYSFADYLGLRLITTLLAVGLILALGLMGGYRAATAWVIVIVGGSKAFDALSDLFLGLFQRRGRMDYFAMTLIVNSGVSLIALSLALWWTHDIVWAALGSMLGSAAALLAFGLPAGAAVLKQIPPIQPRAASARQVWRQRWHMATLRNLAVRAAPLGFASLRPALNLNIPRYFIAYQLGERDLGIFAAIAALVLAGLIITSSLSASIISRLATYYAAGNTTAFRQLMLRMAQIGLAQGSVGVVIAFLAGRAVLTFFFGAEYATYNDVLVWLVLTAAMYVMINLFEMALTAMGRFTIQMRIQLITLVVLIALCFWLTPRYGMYGAAIAMFGSALVTMVAYVLAVSIHFMKISLEHSLASRNDAR